MKKIRHFSCIVILLSIAITINSQGYHKRIAFIGNSITAGYTLPTATYLQIRFSALFDTMLRNKFGDTCIVGNYAVSGRTMLKHGDFPIWNDPEFSDCWQFAPDIFIILLGTNDSKSWNWEPFKADFFGDYISMIDTFKKRNPQTKFIVCLPPPAFAVALGIRDSVIVNAIIPLIDSVAKVTGAAIMDYHTPFLDSAQLFPDYIHPNAEGHRDMAQLIYNKVMQTDYIHQVDTGYTFVSYFVSSKPIVRDIDSITLSWTTISADTAFLNGEIVPVAGSKKVNAKKTTIYTLKAKGKLSTDSLNLTQQFYHPMLTKISISPGISSKKVGDSVRFYVKFQDQHNLFITDTTYTVEWSIVSGAGKLVNATSASVTYVASSEGTAQVIAQVDTIKSNSANITINTATGITNKEILNNDVSVYPNPSEGLLNISVLINAPTPVKIKIIDLNGVVKIEKNQFITNQGEHTFKFGTEGLASGMYILDIEYSGNQNVKKITVIQK